MESKPNFINDKINLNDDKHNNDKQHHDEMCSDEVMSDYEEQLSNGTISTSNSISTSTTPFSSTTSIPSMGSPCVNGNEEIKTDDQEDLFASAGGSAMSVISANESDSSEFKG